MKYLRYGRRKIEVEGGMLPDTSAAGNDTTGRETRSREDLWNYLEYALGLAAVMRTPRPFKVLRPS
jgi:hypothetical protein